jgi:sugar phosphate permease
MILCVTAWVSDKFRTRALVAIIMPIPVLIGYAIVIGTDSHAGGLFAMFLVAAGKLLFAERPVKSD